MMHKVWFLLLPGFFLVDVIGMIAVFKAASALRRTRSNVGSYATRLISLTGGPVLSSSGIALSTCVSPRQLAGRANSLVITGQLASASAAYGATNAQRLYGWISRSQKHLSRCAVLGAKALLPLMPHIPDIQPIQPRARPARQAPHGFHVKRLRPNTFRSRRCGWRALEPGQGLDLALSWVEVDKGTKFADSLALRLPKLRSRRYGTRRYRSEQAEHPPLDARITALHRWILGHLCEKLSVPVLAQQVHMSVRSFARYYERKTGLTPGRGVQQLRLETACRLIETSTLPLKSIAAQCGYGSQEVMRRAFLRSLKMTPLEYRQRRKAMSNAG
jgi:transcriptional regulator GlxA family with amidase domain